MEKKETREDKMEKKIKTFPIWLTRENKKKKKFEYKIDVGPTWFFFSKKLEGKERNSFFSIIPSPPRLLFTTTSQAPSLFSLHQIKLFIYLHIETPLFSSFSSSFAFVSLSLFFLHLVWRQYVYATNQAIHLKYKK